MFRQPRWSSSGLGTRCNRRRLLSMRSHFGITSCGTTVYTIWLLSEYKIKTFSVCKIQRRTIILKRMYKTQELYEYVFKCFFF
jgi:hypothetical protein